MTVTNPYQYDSELAEMLARYFGLEFLRARGIAFKRSFKDFCESLCMLESIMGVENAQEVVKNGKFAEYRNGALDHYFKLALKLTRSLRYKVEKDNLPAFYSVEVLSQFISSKKEKDEAVKEESIDLASLELNRYRLLHADNQQSVQYLETLITGGIVKVSSHEHWTRSAHSSCRGLNILKAIRYQLSRIFDDLNLEPPECSINFGKAELSISENTRERLLRIRVLSYKHQNPL